MAGSLRVIATKLGFYGGRRRYPKDSNKHEGSFTLRRAEDFSARWMQWVDGGPDGKVKPKPEAPKSEGTQVAPPAGSADAAKAAARAEGQEAPAVGKAPDDVLI